MGEKRKRKSARVNLALIASNKRKMNYSQTAEFFVIDSRCTEREIADRMTMGLLSRGLTFQHFLFTRESDSHIYVFYYKENSEKQQIKEIPY
jgi:hypothetical protein